MDQYIHDLYGRKVDDEYWCLLEARFGDQACTLRACGKEHAASTANRLAKTAGNVPAQLIQELQDLWDDTDEYPDGQSPAELTMANMMASLATGYSPGDATWSHNWKSGPNCRRQRH